MKIGIIGDPHASDKPPETRKDNYSQAILDKLEFCIEEGNNRKYNAFIIPGDIFHRKIPAHNSHSMVSSLITIFEKSKCPIYVVAGNHDISGNLTNLYQQPLYVLSCSGAVTLLDNRNPVVLTDGDFRVSINGAPHSASRDQKDASILYDLNHDEKANCKIGIFHQMILPVGATFFNDYINIDALEDINSDILVDGHYHEGFNPTVLEHKDKFFVNGGSISRGSSSQFNLQKRPVFVELLLEKHGDNFDLVYDDIEIPCEDSTKVFDTVAIKKRKETQEMKAFIENLNEFEAESLSTQSPDGILKMLDVMGMSKELQQVAEGYLTDAYETLGK